MGSEMCIRDRARGHSRPAGDVGALQADALRHEAEPDQLSEDDTCLLYTSDAADERSSVDLGGRRIIKKKNMHVIS